VRARAEEPDVPSRVREAGDCNSAGHAREGVQLGAEAAGAPAVEGSGVELGLEGRRVAGDGGAGGHGDGCAIGPVEKENEVQLGEVCRTASVDKEGLLSVTVGSDLEKLFS
jgi:hypothetical protein